MSGRAKAEEQRPVTGLLGYLDKVTGESTDESLLTRALTHRSYSYEHGGLPHNERLEFLGDSVLGLVVTDHLFGAHPDISEGELAKLRAAVVNMRALAAVGREIDLGSYIRLGRGELTTGGREKASILADTVEAVIGAVYRSTPEPRGLAAAGRLVHALLDERMVAAAGMGAGLDWKTSLQEVAAAADLTSPWYRTTAEGPDHDKTFTAEAVVGDEVRGVATGGTKKDAEQQAAAIAYEALSSQGAAAKGADAAPTTD
ncbi:ribonuclease III [Janibacter corallicola]|uniref:ribonuclease III n=1 Tax=Janibacter corallicola TaxID=415212 RepID=UPI0008312412|nr:ribonuclease III [Janibacter corallicola]